MTVTIRRARPGDVPDIHRLITALAVYERSPDAVKATEEWLEQTMFGEDPRVFVHLADRDGETVGVALWFLTYSTWTGSPTLYLEDLFVDESARGLGIGRMLFRALAKEARALGCGRIDWAVLDWNEKAMDFYRSLGAHHSTGWQPWRIEGPALDELTGPA